MAIAKHQPLYKSGNCIYCDINSSATDLMLPQHADYYNPLTHTSPLLIIVVKSTIVQSTGTNNYIGQDLNFNNGLVPECAQLMLWNSIHWVKIVPKLSASPLIEQHLEIFYNHSKRLKIILFLLFKYA